MKKLSLLFLYLIAITILFAMKGNAQNVVYSSLYTSSNFTKTINPTSPVGAIVATPNTVNGSASYSIPIVVPPGTNGLVPNISLTYNSLGGGGIAGMGWSIEGLSSISRVGANFHFEGNVKHMDLSANDRFVLDGSRMIAKTGTYGAIGTTYGTEVENFATITSYGLFGGEPSHFIVETKEGTVMEYGNSNDSRFLDNNNAEFYKIYLYEFGS
jgi:Salmonella virulence plasmid 65kDa B protein